MFGAPITRDTLQGLARAAASDYLTNKTPLTDAVVKQASSYGALTEEHVRRICEMTYHDVFERLHRQSTGADRYISFDPPDAVKAASRLNAQKVASATLSKEVPPGGLMTEKSASESRPRFQPANAFTALMETVQEQRDDDPIRELQEARRQLKEASAELTAEANALANATQHAWLDTSALAYELAKEGASLEDLLRAGFSGVDLEKVSSVATNELGSALVVFLAEKESKTAGFRLSKTASSGDVNPDHPFPRAFAKSAELMSRQEQVRLALKDVQSDLAEVAQALVEVQKAASIAGPLRTMRELGKAARDQVDKNPKAAIAAGAGFGLLGAGVAREVAKARGQRRPE